MLTDEQLWDKCGSGQPITREDLGLSSENRHNGVQTLREGFEVPENGTIIANVMADIIVILLIGIIISIICFEVI